jgi:uncharacterized protein (TIGR03435 family)
MSYKRKLAAGANWINGILNPETKPMPLPSTSATPATAWQLPKFAAAPPLPGSGKAEFEVASIKRSAKSRPGNGGFNVTATRLLSRNTSLQDIITFAFEIHATQLSGLPDWATTEKYDITAKLPQGGAEPSDAGIRTMLKNLLLSRFGFAAHTENRELAVYAISLGKDGAAGIKMAKNRPTERASAGKVWEE